ncbi:MAG: HlyC/CorC family transporter [Alphaproteobacteria bacterium]|nr:HlyC/CorC family transporter [Alphaproteobacteria bacterium]
MEIGLLLSALAVLVLLALSGFFSGSETALTAASQARMHTLEKEGNRRAALVNKIRERKERMIGALLLGNNLVNILATALSTSVLIALVGDAGVFYATIAMTLLVLIFSEVLPKTYALHAADRMAMAIAPVMNIVIRLFSPVTEMVSLIVRAVLKLFGVDISVVAVGSNVEELRGVIEMHQGPEEEVQEQRAMLRSILDLADVYVEEVMIHRKNVMMLDISQPPAVLLDAMLASPYTRLPLWKDDPDNIVGVVHVKTLFKEMQAGKGTPETLDICALASEPWFVPETTTLYDQLQAFRERREHFALVVDEYGAFMGVVTLEDIVEEIIGEIEDEHDVERVAGVRCQTDGTYLVEGQVPIRDLNRAFEWNLPDDEDYSTLAGLILHESQMVPDAGQSFTFFGFRFDVVKRQRNQITLVRVIAPEKIEQDD